MTTASVRYPWPVSSIADLRREVDLAADHGRIGLCAWICLWLPGRPIVRWEQAVEMIGGSAC